MLGTVQRVSDIIGEIATAASERNEGIEQVGAAVTQIDPMTPQNAARVEERTAAAKSLMAQAATLAGVVGGFSIAG